MKKISFSLRNFRRLNYIFFILSAVFTVFWALGIYFFSSSFISFYKGTALLMTYLEDYYFVRTLQDDVVSKALVKDVEDKLGGFIVFYELLNFRDRDYQEIREIWRNFGMEDDETFVVVFGTKIFRVIPGLMDEVRSAANEIYENINNLSTAFNEEEFKKLRSSSVKFLYSFNSTLRRTIIYFNIIVGLAVIYWVLVFAFFIIRYVERLRIIINSLSGSMLSFVKEGKAEKVDIIDEKSEEFLVLQNAANLVIDKNKSLNESISEVENQLLAFVEVIEVNAYTIYEVRMSMEGLISNLSNLDRESIEQNISNLSKTFSIVKKYVYDIKGMFEDFRGRVQNVFEPVETLYEMISKASEDYKQISQTVISYLNESNMFSKAISDALKRQYGELSEIMDSLRRIALNLKNIGINATVEFSRLSSSEALFQISRKIIDTSKNLQDLVLKSSIFIDDIRNDIAQSLDKIDSFYLMVSELSSDIQSISETVKLLLSDKDKVIEHIRHNYKLIFSISEILAEVEKITLNMNNVYYSLESNIKSLLELVGVKDSVKSILDVLDNVYSSLVEVKNVFSKVLENLRRYK